MEQLARESNAKEWGSRRKHLQRSSLQIHRSSDIQYIYIEHVKEKHIAWSHKFSFFSLQ